MIQKFNISRDDSIYHAWPDVCIAGKERLVCVFSECTHHHDRGYTRIMAVTSEDRGRTWTAKRPVTAPFQKKAPHDPHWNCARITPLADGRLAVVVDQIDGGDEERPDLQTNWLFFSRDEGETWDGPHATPVEGIVPDKLKVLEHGPHAGRWLLSAHRKQKHGDKEHWTQRLWFSDDTGKTWQGPVTIAESYEWKVCEGSILELPQGELVCFLRENAFTGIDCLKAISNDGGLTWKGVFVMPMQGCHGLSPAC